MEFLDTPEMREVFNKYAAAKSKSDAVKRAIKFVADKVGKGSEAAAKGYGKALSGKKGKYILPGSVAGGVAAYEGIPAGAKKIKETRERNKAGYYYTYS